MRLSKDEYYLGVALAVSKRSTCLKRRYGCVIVKNDAIVSTGYNGSARGEVNCSDRGTCKRADSERYTDYENCDSVHAEQNAIIWANGEQMIGATVYLSCEEYKLDENLSARHEEDIFGWVEDVNPSPCPICSRMLKNAKIAKVITKGDNGRCEHVYN